MKLWKRVRGNEKHVVLFMHFICFYYNYLFLVFRKGYAFES